MRNYINHPLLEATNAALSKCQVCKDYNTRGGNFLSANSNDLDIMFISQNPGYSNWNKNCDPSEIVPFGLHDDSIGYHRFFDFFRKQFREDHHREPIFYITNIVKCVTEKNAIPSPEMTETCITKFLLLEIKYFRVNSNNSFPICVLGKAANDALTEYNNNVTFTDSIDFYHIYHPGYLNRKGIAFTRDAASKVLGLIETEKNYRETKEN